MPPKKVRQYSRNIARNFPLSRTIVGVAQLFGWLLGMLLVVFGISMAFTQSVYPGIQTLLSGLLIASLNHAVLAGIIALFDIAENTKRSADAAEHADDGTREFRPRVLSPAKTEEPSAIAKGFLPTSGSVK